MAEVEMVEAVPVPRHIIRLSTINKILGWIGLALVVAIRPDYSAGTAFWIERLKSRKQIITDICDGLEESGAMEFVVR